MEGSRIVMNSHLPAGFRFHPTDQELIHSYLTKKAADSLPPEWDIIADIDLYKFNPWELPEKAFFGEKEWFFFTQLDQKYPNGVRPNRAAASGYWKATGTEKPILASDGVQCIGVKRALVFFMGQPRKCTKTQWVMHEYRLLNNSIIISSHSQKPKASMRLDVWVLCHVRQKANILLERNEVPETYNRLQSLFNFKDQSKENAQNDGMNNSSLEECSVNQHLTYPLESYERSDNTMENNSMESDFGSIKRTLSFSLLDELMFLQPMKRLHCSTDSLFSSTEMIPINRNFPEFFI